jgi:hypothetical protein
LQQDDAQGGHKPRNLPRTTAPPALGPDPLGSWVVSLPAGTCATRPTASHAPHPHDTPLGVVIQAGVSEGCLRVDLHTGGG